MPKSVFLGEFEQLVMLCVLHLAERAYAIEVREQLGRIARRPVSRGALYRTLDRLEEKGYVAWEVEDDAPDRGGHARRRFLVTEQGLAMLRASRAALLDLWDGLETVFK